MSSYTTSPQTYSPKAEKKINKLVRILNGVSYDYVAIVAHLRNEDETLEGARKFFKRRSQLLVKDSQTLIKIQQQIGGNVVFKKLEAPSKQEFESLEETLEYSLKKEKKISKVLLELHSELVHDVEPRIVEKIETILQHRDEVLEQIQQQLLHLQQNVGQVGEFQVSQYLEEEHSRSKVDRLEKKIWKKTTTSTSSSDDKLHQTRRHQLSGFKQTVLTRKRPMIKLCKKAEKISYRKKMLLQ